MLSGKCLLALSLWAHDDKDLHPCHSPAPAPELALSRILRTDGEGANGSAWCGQDLVASLNEMIWP